VEDRISGLKSKIHIQEKTGEYLEKRLKYYERNMQECCDSIKIPKL
jgi:hypothetical protein